MQPIYINKILAAASANNISLSQTPLAGGNLLINGAAASGGVATLDTQRRVLLTFAADESARTFVVYGTVQGGGVIQETFAGAAATAVTTQDFKTVTRISIDAASAGAITVGTNGVGSTPWQTINWHVQPTDIGLVGTVSGTVNYTVRYTYDDPSGTYPRPDGSFPVAFNHAIMAALAVNGEGSIQVPVAAIQLQINSGAGTATLGILQAGISGP